MARLRLRTVRAKRQREGSQTGVPGCLSLRTVLDLSCPLVASDVTFAETRTAANTACSELVGRQASAGQVLYPPDSNSRRWAPICGESQLKVPAKLRQAAVGPGLARRRRFAANRLGIDSYSSTSMRSTWICEPL
jgi:hypothetical protein